MIINPQHIELTPFIGLDLETTGLQAWESEIDLIAIKTKDNEYILEASAYTNEYLVSLFKRIQTECKAILHNAKFDVGFIYFHYGVLLRNVHCTEMSAEICENGLQKKLRKDPQYGGKPFSLSSVLKRWLNITHADKEDKRSYQLSFTNKTLRKELARFEAFRRSQMEYAMEDVRHLGALYVKQVAELEDNGLTTIYQLEHKLLPVLVKMEIQGCLIDAKSWKEVIDVFWIPEQKRLEGLLDKEVASLLGGKQFKYSIERKNNTLTQFDLFGLSTTTAVVSDNELNYGSPDQLVELVKFLGEKVPTDDEGKESLEEDSMLVFLTENPESKLGPFINVLLQYRQVSKLVSTYGDKFLGKLDVYSHIHTLYTQTKTETGRLSSKAPNLQNIPKPPKGDLSKDIRRFFVARPGYMFVTCDMSGAEVAIAADYSQEPLLLDALRLGADMHSELASVSFSIIFNTPTKISKSNTPFIVDEKEYIPEELRDVHKSVVFAKFYKGGAKRVYGVLSQFINAHWKAEDRMRIATEISVALDKKMPKLSEYLSSLINKAKKEGFLRTSSFGRIRHFDQNVYGEAANAPIQGTNAEAIKMAMINLDKYFTETGYGRLVMNIHDEVVCEVREEFCGSSEVNKETKKQDKLGIAAIEVKKIVSDSLSYFLKTIKGGASVSVSKHWKK